MKDNTIKYQMVLVLAPKTEEKDREKILAKVESWLGDHTGKIAKKDHWGMKDLVYKIVGNTKGDFWILDVEATKPVKLNELNLFLNREVNVIRYLILKK